MSASSDGYEGNIAVCTTLVIQASQESEMDEVWDTHKAWLQRSHGPMGLLTYSVAKSVNDDGTLVYVIHEIYQDADGLKQHYERSGEGGYEAGFLRIAQADGNTMIVLEGSPVTHSLSPKDLAFS